MFWLEIEELVSFLRRLPVFNSIPYVHLTVGCNQIFREGTFFLWGGGGGDWHFGLFFP